MPESRGMKYTVGRTHATSGPGVALYELRPEGDGLAAAIAPESGGELASLRLQRGGEALELLYRACDFSPTEGWCGRAPLLWPAVGRQFTAEQIEEARRSGEEPAQCRYRLRGRTWEIPCHGFARSRPWSVLEHEAHAAGARLACALESDDITRAAYPFDFRLVSTFRLRGPRLQWEVQICAAESNREALPFSIGNHLSLRFPFTPRGRWADGRLRGPATREFGITDISLLDGSSRPRDFPSGQALSDPTLCNLVTGGFEDDCSLTLVEPGAFGVRVSQFFTPTPGLEFSRYFVLWGEPDLRYFCPEPWLGGPNSLNTGQGLVRLAPGGQCSWTMQIEVLGEGGAA